MDEIERLAKAIKERNHRIYMLHYTGAGVSTDELLDCPICKNHRAVELSERGWTCLYKDCPFVLPEIFHKLMDKR